MITRPLLSTLLFQKALKISDTSIPTAMKIFADHISISGNDREERMECCFWAKEEKGVLWSLPHRRAQFKFT